MQNYKNYYMEFGPTVAGQTQYFLPNSTWLSGKKIFKIETWDHSDLTVTQNGQQPIVTADLKKAYLNLVFVGTNAEYIQVPLIDLIITRDNVTTSTNHPFSQFEFQMTGQVIDWGKSYIQLGNASGLQTNRYFHFLINYSD